MPGPRQPELTPYVIQFTRVVAERRHRRVVLCMFSQGGKTDGLLDIMGHRLDESPAPILYVGPSKQFITEQFEPRVMDLLDEAATLRGKVQRGKRMTKTRKVIAGVPLRLAHAGSSTALKSDPASLALTDEADELLRNVRGQGDPIGLVDRRGDTHADFVHAIVSTPSMGPSETERDTRSGLEFWKPQDPQDLESRIWALFQEGTRHHWAWPCPHCGRYFVPRFELLKWPKDATPWQARRSAYLECPNCQGEIHESDKPAMNERGVYVAPGQRVDRNGTVTGRPPDSDTYSLWVSGLCSPFVSFGERAADFLTAHLSGDPEEIQTVINGGFGELYAPGGGEVPEWIEVARLRMPYERATIPDGVLWLTAGIDVQKDRLIWVIRGWGMRQESWLIDHGELWGATEHEQVWLDLVDLLETEYERSLRVRRAFVDSGFRPGKPDIVPQHMVYEFCRRYSRLAYATKGWQRRQTPLSRQRIDVNRKGQRAQVGLDLIHLDSDFFKSWVHERVRWPEDQPGAWHLHSEVDEDYCRQIVSEARMRKPSGGVTWVSLSRENHFLDCEALAYAAAYMLGVHRMKAQRRAPEPPPPDDGDSAPVHIPRQRGGGWLGGSRGGWLQR